MAKINLTYPVRYAPFVTQEYAMRPEYYGQFTVDGVKLKGHNGIDLRAPDGTEVIACDDGFCQEAVDQGSVGYGKYVKIIHIWGETVYAHLKKISIKQGEQAKRGQTIGLADNTGNSSGSHLHLGMRANPYNRKDGWGGYSDPAPYLFGSGSSESLPQWLVNFLTERQVEIGQAEPAIRSWAEAFSKVKSWEEKEGNWNDFISDLAGQMKPKSNSYSDLIARVTELREYEVKTKEMEANYGNFVVKVATSINSNNTIAGRVLNDLTKFVADSKPVNLDWKELIALGIQKFLQKFKSNA